MTERDSLKEFLHEAILDHDAGASASEMPTVLVDGDATSDKRGEMGTLPGHEVQGFIARGGMGAVYLARQQALEREVAVKVMTREADSPEMAERFRREALVLGRLAHPNIVPVYDIGTDDEGQLFYTMKLVKGRTLQHILNDLRNGDSEALRTHTLTSLLTVFRKVCDALAFSHSQGIIHRDLKPENVMVGEFGEVLVMDWGLAKMTLRSPEGNDGMTNGQVEPSRSGSSFDIRNSSFRAASNSASFKTLDGAVMGTPQYMSPEQAMGLVDELDARSDIFSLGGILYAILTLRPPVEGATVEEVLSKVRTGQITSPSERQTGTTPKGKTKVKGTVLEAGLIKPLPHVQGGRVPAALSAVVMKALRVEKVQRYPSVTVLSEDIDAYQRGFATSAEQAGALRQIMLLMLRHKAVTASLVTLLLISVGFVLKVMASERKATLNARRADDNAAQTRRTLGVAQVALAEAAFRSANLPAMVKELDAVPTDLRDQRWAYLSGKRDASRVPYAVSGFQDVNAVVSVPHMAGQFAIASPNGAVGIVDVRSGAVLHRIETGLSGKMVLAISPDGKRLAATAFGAAEVRLFLLADGKPDIALSSPSREVVWMTFSPDGNSLAVVDATPPSQTTKPKISMVDVKDGRVRWQDPGIAWNNAVFNADGTRLFVGSVGEKRFAAFDASNGKIIQEASEYVECMALSRDGKKLALGLKNGDLVLVDPTTGIETRRARLHAGGITAVIWTAADHLITFGREDGIEGRRQVLRLWETTGFSARGSFFGVGLEGDDRPTTPDPSTYRSFYGIGYSVGHPPVFDFNSYSGHLLKIGRPPQLWRIPVDVDAAPLTCVGAKGYWSTCFLDETTLLARGCYALRRYNVSDPQSPRGLSRAMESRYVTVAPCLSRGYFALGCRLGDPPFTIRIMSTKNCEVSGSMLEVLREIPTDDRVMHLDFDSKGARLLAAIREQQAVIYDVTSGAKLLTLPDIIHRGVFAGTGGNVIAIVPGKRVASDFTDELVLFDGRSGARLKSITYGEGLGDIAASPDRRLIAVGGGEHIVQVIDADTLGERFSFRAHDGEVSALAFHPKLPQLASTSSDGSVKVWEYEKGKLKEVFYGFDGTPRAIAFNPSGQLLSVESEQDPTGRLFDLRGQIASGTVTNGSAATASASSTPRASESWQDLILDLTMGRKPLPIPPNQVHLAWEDVLGKFTLRTLAMVGHGWRMDESRAFHCPDKPHAVLAFDHYVLYASYILRVRLQKREDKQALHFSLPVGDRLAGFDLDGLPADGHWTGLTLVNGKTIKEVPGNLHGEQIRDPQVHELEFNVQLDGTKATINTTLDGRPLHAWVGPFAELGQEPEWQVPGENPAVGTMTSGWVLHQAMVQRDY